MRPALVGSMVLSIVVTLAAARSHAQAVIEVDAPPCVGLPIAELEPLLRLEVEGRLPALDHPLVVHIEARACDAVDVRVWIRGVGRDTRDVVSLTAHPMETRPRALALIVGALMSTGLDVAESDDDHEDASAAALAEERLAEPERDARLAAELAPAPIEPVESLDARDPAAEAASDTFSLRWAVLAEIRGAPEGTELAGGVRAAIGVCSPRLRDLLYGCVRADAGLIGGALLHRNYALGQLTGGVSLEVGVRPLAPVLVEAGPRIEFSFEWTDEGRLLEGTSTQILLGGIVRATGEDPIAHVVGEIEVAAVLTPNLFDDGVSGIYGAVFVARVGVGH